MPSPRAWGHYQRGRGAASDAGRGGNAFHGRAGTRERGGVVPVCVPACRPLPTVAASQAQREDPYRRLRHRGPLMRHFGLSLTLLLAAASSAAAQVNYDTVQIPPIQVIACAYTPTGVGGD